MFDRIKTFFRGGTPAAPQFRNYAERPTTRSTAIQPPPQRSGQGVVAAYREKVLPLVRYAVRQDPHAAALITKQTAAVIGDGIALRSEAVNPARKVKVQSAFDAWAKAADATRTLSFEACQELLAREFYEAGEVFLRRRTTKAGIALEIISAERVHVGNADLPASGNTVVDGVEFNADGAVVAYHVWPQPDDANQFVLRYVGQPERIDAEDMIHIYRPLRAGQFRGFPPLAPALDRLDTLHATLVALQERQEASAKFLAFLKAPLTQDGIVPLTGLAGTPNSDGRYVVSMENSTVQVLAPGDEVQFSTPPDPGNDGVSFSKFLLRGVCATLGFPYEQLLGDYDGANDRLGRLIRLDAQRAWQNDQYNVFGPALERVWRWVLDDAQERNVLPQLGTDEYKVRCVAQAWPYVHPVQEVQAAKLAIEAGLLDRSTAAAEQGRNAEDIDRAQSFDNARAKALDLNYGQPANGQANSTGGAQ